MSPRRPRPWRSASATAGFPAADVELLGPNDRKKNVVVRLHGTGSAKPVPLIGHLDVVEARREDWSSDPFQLIEKDGYFYGRGSSDMKDGDAIMVTALLRHEAGRIPPERDIILALTADEEGGCCNGAIGCSRTGAISSTPSSS